MNTTELQTLCEGDKIGVAYLAYRDRGPQLMRLGVIEKINGHGHFTVQFETGGPLTFKKDGWEKGPSAKAGSHYLVEYDRAYENNRVHRLQQAANLRIHQIESFINGKKNGYGNVKISRDDLERIHDMLRDFPVVE